MIHSPRRRRFGNIAAGILLAVTLIELALWITGCTVRQQTVSPPAIVSTQASFDGNVQNSGVIGPDGIGGFYVTPHFVQRYDSLLVKYGERLSPPMKSGDRTGIKAAPVDRFQVTAEMIARFRTMNLWRKAEAGP